MHYQLDHLSASAASLSLTGLLLKKLGHVIYPFGHLSASDILAITERAITEKAGACDLSIRPSVSI